MAAAPSLCLMSIHSKSVQLRGALPLPTDRLTSPVALSLEFVRISIKQVHTAHKAYTAAYYAYHVYSVSLVTQEEWSVGQYAAAETGRQRDI